MNLNAACHSPRPKAGSPGLELSPEAAVGGALRSPLWLSLWLVTVGVGVFGFLEVGLAALSR